MPKTYDHIEDYFNLIRNILSEFDYLIVSSEIKYETRTAEEGTISGFLCLINKSELHICEYITIEDNCLVRSTYRFHWQDNKKQVIVRWDNAPHFPKLAKFPFHKHTADKVVPTDSTNLLQVLENIRDQIALILPED